MREITQKKKKDSLYGIIAGILDNITTLHLHGNFPGAFCKFIIAITDFSMATDDFFLAPVTTHEKIDLSIAILTTFSSQLNYFQRLNDLSSQLILSGSIIFLFSGRYTE